MFTFNVIKTWCKHQVCHGGSNPDTNLYCVIVYRSDQRIWLIFLIAITIDYINISSIFFRDADDYHVNDFTSPSLDCINTSEFITDSANCLRPASFLCIQFSVACMTDHASVWNDWQYAHYHVWQGMQWFEPILNTLCIWILSTHEITP